MSHDPQQDSFFARAARRPLLHCLFILLLCLGAYLHTLSAPMLWDELDFILLNPYVDAPSHILNAPDNGSDKYYRAFRARPVSYLTFALNHKLSPAVGVSGSTRGYHMVNITLHMLCALLAYALVLITLRPLLPAPLHTDNDTVPAEPAALVALLAAGVFAAHPIQSEAVTYIFQRHVLLAALFSLLTLITYALAASAGPLRTRLRRSLLALSVLSCVMAMLSKESALTLPLLVILYDLSFIRRTRQEEPRSALLWRVAPFVLTLPLIPLNRLLLEGNASISSAVAPLLRGHAAIEPSVYFMTQLRVMMTYLRMLVFPAGQNIDHDYALQFNWLSAPVLLSAVAILVLLSASVWMLTRNAYSSEQARTAARAAGFGVLWFFLCLSVESSIVPLPMVMSEYRLYLPSLGIFTALAAFIVLIVLPALRLREPGRQTLMLTLSLCMVLGVMTFARNSLWLSPVAIWEDTAEKSPGKARVHYNLAKAYEVEGRFMEAANSYLRSAALLPGGLSEVHARFNLGILYERMGLDSDAIEQYLTAASVMPQDHAAADPLYNLGVLMERLGKEDNAQQYYHQAIELDPGGRIAADALFNLGAMAFQKKHYIESAKWFKKVLEIHPDEHNARINRAICMMRLRAMPEARRELTEVLRRDPDNKRATSVLRDLNQWQ